MLDLDLKRSEIDLNSRLLYSHCEAARGVLHEQWPNDFCSGDGFSSSDGIPSLRGTLPWRLQSAELLLLGSVSLFGLRPTHRARKPARYRSLSTLAAVEALSSGFSRPHFSQHIGARQRNARLAHLRRFRAGAHRPGSPVVSRRAVGCGVGPDPLCAGFHHHRFVFGDVSLDAVPSPQECGQSAYSARSARQHSDQCLCDQRRGARYPHSGPTAARSGSVLSARPRILGLRASVRAQTRVRFLHHARQTEHAVLAARLAAGAPGHGAAIRSDHSTHRPKTSRLYPDPLRRIHYFDAQKDLRLIFLTNKFRLPALTIANLYRARWRVELFFRWIKQHLHIKSFFGTSENAVKPQVWVAITVYVLVAIVKKQAPLDLSLYNILQILSITLFEKTQLSSGFSHVADKLEGDDPCTQLKLFGL